MYGKEVLPNGVRIVTEEIPYVRSVAVGIWVGVGSRDELPEEHGVSHFLEHLMFKGTERRTAKEIAEALDAVGGQLNAFTTKEYTCYYAKVLDEHMDLAVDVLTDMFFNSLFAEKEIEKEKKVVLEEIKMYEDSPDELVHDLFATHVWANHKIGRPILGTQDSVANLNRDLVYNYFKNHYTTPNIVVAVAGKIKHQEIVDKLTPIFTKLTGKAVAKDNTIPVPHTGINCIEKSTEQLQLCLGVPGLSQEDENIYQIHLINNILGGGLSSRLFQEIREERGLAYSVYSYHSAFRDSGLFTVYAGTSPDNFDEVTGLVIQELSKLKNQPIDEDEISRTKEQIKGNIFLGLENVSSRMSRLGKSELCFNRIISPDEIIEKITKVTAEDVKQMAERLFDAGKISITTIGPSCSNLKIEEIINKYGIQGRKN